MIGRLGWAQLSLRLSIAASFAVSAGGRFSESGWDAFLSYTAALVPYAPEAWIPGVAATAQGVEMILAAGLASGYRIRFFAGASALLLFVYASSMLLWDPEGWAAPFWYSVFTAAAASLTLAMGGLGPRACTVPGSTANPRHSATGSTPHEELRRISGRVHTA